MILASEGVVLRVYARTPICSGGGSSHFLGYGEAAPHLPPAWSCCSCGSYIPDGGRHRPIDFHPHIIFGLLYI